MAQQTMYPAVANSPQTELSAGITASVTTIAVLDASKLPTAPNIATIGVDESAETIRYSGISGNTLTGVTRGFQGASKSWVMATPVARNFTAYDHDALRNNITNSAKMELSNTAPISPDTNTYWYEDMGDTIDLQSGGSGVALKNGSTDGSSDIWLEEI